MTAEGTRRIMEAYFGDLIGRGAYKRHFADDVVITIEGTEQRAEGPDGVEGLIDYFHRKAFDARPELKNTLFADDRAVAEFDFVGEHVGEFAEMAATGMGLQVAARRHVASDEVVHAGRQRRGLLPAVLRALYEDASG